MSPPVPPPSDFRSAVNEEEEEEEDPKPIDASEVLPATAYAASDERSFEKPSVASYFKADDIEADAAAAEAAAASACFVSANVTRVMSAPDRSACAAARK